MSNSKHSRHTPSPSSPVLTHGSKLPKFLQKQSTRDRSKSMTDPTFGSTSTTSLASGSSSSASPPETPIPGVTFSSSKPRKSSKFLPPKEKYDRDRAPSSYRPTPTDNATPNANSNDNDNDNDMDEPPVIIEPVAIPRPRTRSERPLSTASELPPSTLYSSTSSASRIGDLPTRLSGWFSHTFSTSSTDLSLPSLLSQSHLANSASPKGKGSALLTAAKHGKGHLDKAVRYLLDSDATPDKCTDPIWLLGVQHPGYEPPPPMPAPPTSPGGPRRTSTDSRRHGSPHSFRSSTSSSNADPSLSQSQSQSQSKNPANNWPPVFYADFTSRIWVTYRSQFTPIRDIRLCDLSSDPGDSQTMVGTSPSTKRWNWPVGGEKGWTSDAGWGCMLRTGQSLLANSLLHLHLGRDWRRPPYPVHTADYATYVQIVTWFFDTPSPDAPFSVHRMALAGKELGKDVGQWFGPSTAAGAIKALVHAFPEALLGVSVGADGAIYQSDVYAASHSHVSSPRRSTRNTWGDRAVLVLLGIRLGIDGVNPIYYDTIKALYTFPQTVGIAGGRPSSSYYFVGSQADNLFYLDPHHARPTIPLRPAPRPTNANAWERESTPDSDRDRDRETRRNQRSPSLNHHHHHRIPTSPSSTRTGSSTFSYHAPMSPSPLQQQLSSSSAASSTSSQTPYYAQTTNHNSNNNNAKWQPSSQPASPGGGSSEMDQREFGQFGGPSGGGLDPVQEHYVTAYSATELKTFHCDRVRKMPLSGLDPSMLLGFLCKDEADWVDFRERVGELSRNYKTIFSIQDEPPNWPSDSEEYMGLESISEPDDMDIDLNEPEDEEGEKFFDTRSTSGSTSSHGHGRRKSEEMDTEEDPVDPITPGPGSSKFEINESGKGDADNGNGDENEGDREDDDIEDDWVDPSIPAPRGRISPLNDDASLLPPPPPPPSPPLQVPPLTKSKSSSSNGKKSGSKKVKKSGQIPVPVPMPMVAIPSSSSMQEQEHYPFPVSADEVPERSRTSSKQGGKRMHTARARDGGRTQSGGVKGILTED